MTPEREADARDGEPNFIEGLQGFASMCDSGAVDKHDGPMLANKFRDAAVVISMLQNLRDEQSAELARLRIALATAEREAKDAKALAVARGKVVKKCRDMFINIKDELEDEGDRIYFGSTNHADDFKQCVDELDSWNWQAIIDEGKIADIYEISRKAHEQLRAAESRAASLEGLLTEARENQSASQRMTASVERSLNRSIALYEAAEALLTEAGKALKPFAIECTADGGPFTAYFASKDVRQAFDTLTRVEAREGGEEKGA